MQSQFVFQDKKEIERLEIQSRLLYEYENPIFENLFAERSDLAVLDVGCNEGKKTTDWFASDKISKVVGLEYNEDLAKAAQKKYGNDKFSFYHCDVEADDFIEKLRNWMLENSVDSFDIIYFSFVLLHLHNPSKLLVSLRQFLKPNGNIVVIETNDSASTLIPDKEGLLVDFFGILKKDIYAGNRELVNILPDMLRQCGYENINIYNREILAHKNDKEKKRDIFETLFSYLPEDVKILCDLYPDNEEYKSWSNWVDTNYEKLKYLVIKEDSSVSVGLRMFSCSKR